MPQRVCTSSVPFCATTPTRRAETVPKVILYSLAIQNLITVALEYFLLTRTLYFSILHPLLPSFGFWLLAFTFTFFCCLNELFSSSFICSDQRPPFFGNQNVVHNAQYIGIFLLYTDTGSTTSAHYIFVSIFPPFHFFGHRPCFGNIRCLRSSGIFPTMPQTFLSDSQFGISSSNTARKQQSASENWDKASADLPFYPDPTYNQLLTRRNINYSSPLRILPRHTPSFQRRDRIIVSPQTAAPSTTRKEVSRRRALLRD